jgi:hypothetical protein
MRRRMLQEDLEDLLDRKMSHLQGIGHMFPCSRGPRLLLSSRPNSIAVDPYRVPYNGWRPLFVLPIWTMTVKCSIVRGGQKYSSFSTIFRPLPWFILSSSFLIFSPLRYMSFWGWDLVAHSSAKDSTTEQRGFLAPNPTSPV